MKRKALFLFVFCFYSINIYSFLLQVKDNFNLIEFKKNELLFNQSKYPESLNNSLELLKRDLSLEVKFRTLFLIAEIYRKNNNHSKSIEYYNKALTTIGEFSNYKDSKGNFFDEYDLRSISFLKLGNEYLKNNQKDSAKLYYQKVLKESSLNDRVLSYKGSASSNLSGIYRKDSLYKKAKFYAEKAIEIQRKRNNKISQAVSLGNLASIYLDLNNFDKAKKTYKSALLLIKNEKSDRALRVREKLYLNLAYNLYILKDYKAYTYQELSYNIKDTLRDKEIRLMIEELGFKYDFNSKKELFFKQEENKRLKEQRAFWIGGIIALLIIISLGYVIKLKDLRRKNLALNFKQKELIKNQEIEKIRSDSNVRVLNATLDGKESERKEIAETLHDSVSALLSSANLHLQATRKQFNGSTPIEIDKTQKIINEASHKVRDLSHNLVSSVLLKFGLSFAIRDVADKYTNSQLTIETKIVDIKRYSQHFEIKVYNILQELINNILKHSKASNALIQMKDKNNTLYLIISDDGIGFDKTKINTKSGLGINQIEARIKMLEGKFDINSSKGNGTTISVEIPIVEKQIANHV